MDVRRRYPVDERRPTLNALVCIVQCLHAHRLVHRTPRRMTKTRNEAGDKVNKRHCIVRMAVYSSDRLRTQIFSVENFIFNFAIDSH